VRIERLSGDVGSAVEFSEVLIAADDAGIRVGRPLVDGARVLGEIVAQTRDKKVLVYKKKRRKNYRRRKGHRQYLTSVRVTEIA
jgi:large subunit ribosomal protein L21